MSGARAGGVRSEPGAVEIEDDPTVKVRDQRRLALIDEFIPRIRRLNPLWSDDEVIEMAESMAELRLLDEELDR